MKEVIILRMENKLKLTNLKKMYDLSKLMEWIHVLQELLVQEINGNVSLCFIQILSKTNIETLENKNKFNNLRKYCRFCRKTVLRFSMLTHSLDPINQLYNGRWATKSDRPFLMVSRFFKRNRFWRVKHVSILSSNILKLIFFVHYIFVSPFTMAVVCK